MPLTPQDRQAIESVFDRIQQVERQGSPRDTEAEQLIEQRLQAQPGAAYYLAQTVLIQEQALQKAQERLQSLESGQGRAQSASSGVTRPSIPGIGSRLGASQQAAPVAGPQGAPASNLSNAGFGRSAGAGGGFLAGAMQTAVGVAGGLMLGNMLSGLFGGNEAQAGEVPPGTDAAQDPGAGHPGEQGHADDGGFDDGGGFDEGGFGEF
ncbi:DUF2076 family protein [Orrella sp. JC864]|uniref:DUF2076 domain-containing protein n=1 Tax=Orrella sp. JC864 TaxID=3120298 RepID=UPI00300A92CC